MEQKPEAVASTDQLGLMPERDLPTMADVLDALTVFNKPAEGDEPWSATQFIAVTALPEFIHNVGRAWYGRFALEMAVAAERERCAKVCERVAGVAQDRVERDAALDCAGNIRLLSFKAGA